MIPFDPAGGLHTLSGGALVGAIPWITVVGFLLVAAVATAVAIAAFERAEP